MLTAILSSFNEIHNDVFWQNLSILQEQPDLEIIVVDGGSQDGTWERLAAFHPHRMDGSRRGSRYNWGLDHARGDKILMIHPRTQISADVIRELQRLDAVHTWGAFRHSFDVEHPLLQFTSWYSNNIRGRGKGIFYLDHCLFITKDLKPQARFPDTSIFEDTYFCLQLKDKVWPRLMSESVVTSAVRFKKNGVWRQSLLNQALKVMFHLNVSEKWMNRVYERGLRLNDRADG